MGFKLREDLLLGVATASTQIEGGDKNNMWYEWTKNHDKTNDKTDCLLANSHWENYKEHIDLMKELNFQIYRLSIEWSRIEPEEGVFSKEGIQHYIDEINYLKSKGIEPLVTLHHFSNPIWFDKKGGFKNKKYAVERFAKYTEFVVNHLKGLVTEFCTINEPNVYTILVFYAGCWLQEEKSFKTTVKVLRNLSYCHIESYKIIHRIIPEAKVGIALNITRFVPFNKKSLIDRVATWFYDRCFNTAIANAMAYGKLTFPLGLTAKKGEYFDYLGINYYTTHEIKGTEERHVSKGEYNDLGWVLDHQGFRDVLKRFHKMFNKDIYVTENGTCDHRDAFRPQYIYDHLNVLSDLDFVKKYYHWTFMDNFEWKEGQAACFGLVEYHYEDATYTPRPSAYLYKEIIAKHECDEDMMARYNLKETVYDK